MTGPAPAPARVAICTVLRNERRYILEWIAHHRLLGVERFLVFDNESDDGSGPLLAALQARGLATVVYWPGRGMARQLAAFEAGAAALSFQSDFVALLDLDEFLLTDDGESLPGVLARLPADVGGLAVCQRVFGSGAQQAFEPGLVTARFTRRAADDRDEHRWVKAILRPEFVRHFTSPHSAALSFGRTIMTDGASFVASGYPGSADRIRHGGVRLNHYMLKPREEFAAKQRRGGFSDTAAAPRFTDEYFTARDPACNEVTDRQAAARAGEVRAEMARMIEGFSDEVRRGIEEDVGIIGREPLGAATPPIPKPKQRENR